MLLQLAEAHPDRQLYSSLLLQALEGHPEFDRPVSSNPGPDLGMGRDPARIEI